MAKALNFPSVCSAQTYSTHPCIQLGSTAIEAGPKQGNCLCHLCGQEVPVKKMLHHVGHHVIASKMDVNENLQQQVSGFLKSIQIFCI